MESEHHTYQADTPQILNAQLCFATYTAGMAFNRVYRQQLQPLGLTYPQYVAMVVLWAQDGITIGTLGDQVALETNTLTPMLKRLEGMGLIERRRDTADERRVLIHLTQTGRAMQERATDILPRVNKATGLSVKELARLTHQMHSLRRNLTDHADRNEQRPG